MKEITFVLF